MKNQNNITKLVKEIKFQRLFQKTKGLADDCKNFKMDAIKEQRFEDAAHYRDMEKTSLDEINKAESKLRKLKLYKT